MGASLEITAIIVLFAGINIEIIYKNIKIS